jgi:phi13 family phage major tail protein
MDKNKVLYGLSNVHVAKITETAGVITYGTPFKMPGVTGLNANPEGESSPFYADNVTYHTVVSNNGYTGDLVVAVTPEQFFTDILGQTKDTNGAIIENAEDKNARFALMCEIDGDAQKRRIVFYDCTATRPSRDNSTVENTITPGTETIPLVMKARTTDKAIRGILEPSETNTAIYNTFFTKVYEKDAVPAG